MNDLKPCPFCGKPAVHQVFANADGAKCPDSKCPGWDWLTIERWNRRPPSPAQGLNLEADFLSVGEYLGCRGDSRDQLAALNRIREEIKRLRKEPKGERPTVEQAWAEIRDTMADNLLNMHQKKTFVVSILQGQLANPPIPEPSKES